MCIKHALIRKIFNVMHFTYNSFQVTVFLLFLYRGKDREVANLTFTLHSHCTHTCMHTHTHTHTHKHTHTHTHTQTHTHTHTHSDTHTHTHTYTHNEFYLQLFQFHHLFPFSIMFREKESKFDIYICTHIRTHTHTHTHNEFYLQLFGLPEVGPYIVFTLARSVRNVQNDV